MEATRQFIWGLRRQSLGCRSGSRHIQAYGISVSESGSGAE